MVVTSSIERAIQYHKSITAYLEKRKRMFEALACPQMVLEKRFYHLGLDITTSKGTKIYAPLDGAYEIIQS